MKLSVIFENKPARWGFRGDPYFWDYLRERAENMDMMTPDELENWIKEECRILVQHGPKKSNRISLLVSLMTSAAPSFHTMLT